MLICILIFPVAAETVHIDASDNPITEGNSLTQTCAASGGNPETYTYQWWFTPNVGMDEKRVGYEAVLRVEDMAYTDAGWYRCEAMNYGGAANSTHRVVVQCQYAVLMLKK